MDDELVQAVADALFRRFEPHLPNLAAATAEPESLKLAEVQRRTGFSYDSVYDAVTRGDLPATKKGREWRVAVKDMRLWMDKDRVGVPTPSRSALHDKITRLMPGLSR